MYFIKINTLKEKIKRKELFDREALPYFFLFIILYELNGIIPPVEPLNFYDHVFNIAALGITIIGTYYCYHQNGKSDGYDFILKYIVLGWVVFIRCFLVFVPFFIIVQLIGQGFLNISQPSMDIVDLCAFTLLGIYFYERLGFHIQDVR